MPVDANGAGDGDFLQQDAADWFSRMRGPDAEHYRPAFDAWRTARPEHQEAYERIGIRWQQADLLSQTPSGRGRAGLSRHTRGVRPIYALAACLVGAILIGLIALSWSSQLTGGSSAGPQVAESTQSSPVGLKRLRLSDGSLVTLDADSSITIQMGRAERRIVLTKGRARFDVAHDPARPFVVSAGDGEVIAHGTVFDVTLTSGHACVSLLKGAVEVRQASAGSSEKRVVARLVPGQAIVLGDSAPVPQVVQTADTVWASGMLAFENAPLSQVLATANRYSQRKVAIEDASLGALRVTGTFRADRPDELAATLAAAFGLEIVPRGDGIVLRRRTRPGS